MNSPRRLGLALATLAPLLLPGAALADGSAEQRLVEAYAPVLMVRAQESPPCDTAEEQYRPTALEAIGSIVFALLIPFVAIGQTLLYFDLDSTGEEVEVRRWRWRLLRRPLAAET